MLNIGEISRNMSIEEARAIISNPQVIDCGRRGAIVRSGSRAWWVQDGCAERVEIRGRKVLRHTLPFPAPEEDQIAGIALCKLWNELNLPR